MMAASESISEANVLHCDKVSWFRHIQAPTMRSAVQASIVSGENGLGNN
jgi:hypothetical protein